MKIKHFAGYGSVVAKKMSTREFTSIYGGTQIEITIQVRGDHERGLANEWDTFGMAEWLLRQHFMKDIDMQKVESMSCRHDCERADGRYEEICNFTFKIRK